MYTFGMPSGNKMPGTMHPYGKTLPEMQSNKMMPGGMAPDGMMPFGMMPGMMPAGKMPGEFGAKTRPGLGPGGLAPGGYVPGGVTPLPTERPMRGEAVRPERQPEAADAGSEALVRSLEQYMKDQVTAAAFYRRLEETADDARVKGYLRHAREDEQKHYRMLRQAYQNLTGRSYEATPAQVTFASLTDGLIKAAEDEIEAFEEYRDEYLRQTEPRLRQLFFELMTDEIEHATRFNLALHLLP